MTQFPSPPFSISVQAADHLAKIVESITRLELGTNFRLDIRLHRENRVRSIYSSPEETLKAYPQELAS